MCVTQMRECFRRHDSLWWQTVYRPIHIFSIRQITLSAPAWFKQISAGQKFTVYYSGTFTSPLQTQSLLTWQMRMTVSWDVYTVYSGTVRSSAKRLSKLGKSGKRYLHLLDVLIQGGDALLFITKTYSCWELRFATGSNSSVNPQSTVAVVTTWTPTLQIRQNWQNHLPNETVVSSVTFKMDSSIN
jgi:hypothetical protein